MMIPLVRGRAQAGAAEFLRAGDDAIAAGVIPKNVAGKLTIIDAGKPRSSVREWRARQGGLQPTSGIRRVFWQFSTPHQGSVFERCPRSTHLRQ
jgi:hypothetical protein